MAGLWMIRDTQLLPPYIGNPLLNIYGYRSNLAVIDEANQLLTAFRATMNPLIIAVQSTALLHSQLEAIQLDGTGYATLTPVSDRAGLVTGEYMPRFTAWGYKYVRAAIGDRSGAKRIPGVPEEWVDNDVRASAALTDTNALAVGMQSPIQFGIIDTWFPVILERPIPPSTTWGDHPVGSVNFSAVTTQNSRKR